MNKIFTLFSYLSMILISAAQRAAKINFRNAVVLSHFVNSAYAAITKGDACYTRDSIPLKNHLNNLLKLKNREYY